MPNCTSPDCQCPPRAALLTGQYASRLGLAGGQGEPRVVLYAAGRVGLPPGVPTLASLARQANYSTGAVGKWHLGLHGQEWGDQLKDGKRLETMRRSRSIRPTVFDWIREDQSGKKRLLESAETGILVLVGHVFYAK